MGLKTIQGDLKAELINMASNLGWSYRDTGLGLSFTKENSPYYVDLKEWFSLSLTGTVTVVLARYGKKPGIFQGHKSFTDVEAMKEFLLLALTDKVRVDFIFT